MTEEEKAVFRNLFSKYCREQIKQNRCEDDYCEFCPINKAYEEIFKETETDEENEDISIEADDD